MTGKNNFIFYIVNGILMSLIGAVIFLVHIPIWIQIPESLSYFVILPLLILVIESLIIKYRTKLKLNLHFYAVSYVIYIVLLIIILMTIASPMPQY